MSRASTPPAPLTAEQQQRVAANLGLASLAARKFEAAHPQLVVQLGGFADALQIARLALMRAAQRYDPSIAKFSTFAVVFCFRWLQREATKSGHIRIPAHHTGRERAAIARRVSCRSLERCLFRANDREPAMRDDRTAEQEQAAIEEAIGRLDPREGLVLSMRREGKTLAAIARDLGCCRERIRQIERVTIERIRAELRARGWDVAS